MILVDGQPATAVSALDRGLNYGDGLFETLRVHRGELPLLVHHLARLAGGCERLDMAYPGDALLAAELGQVAAAGPGDAVIRLTLTRGEGGRGYAPPSGSTPRRILARHPLPAWPARSCVVGTCRSRLGHSPTLAGLKHLGRLEQVLAAGEVARAGWDEGLMLDADGQVIEGTRHNLWFLRGGALWTPPVTSAGVAGLVRGLVLAALDRLGLPGGVASLRYDELHEVEGLVLCNAVVGLRVVTALDGRELPVAVMPPSLRGDLRAAGLRWLE